MSNATGIVKLASGLRCKVSDLAIIVKSPVFPENLGCIVEVLRAESITPGGKFRWTVISRGRAVRYSDCNTGADRGYTTGEVSATDSSLLPICGAPLEGSTEAADVRIAEAEMLGFANLAKAGKSAQPTNAPFPC